MKKYLKLALFCCSVFFLSSMTMANANTANGDIIDKAMAAPNLSTLVTAVKEAGLVDTLKGKGPFTVFAPTNEAFAKLPAGTLEKLLKNKKQLTNILTYHVVSGEVMSKDIQNGKVKTVEGQDVKIMKDGDKVTVNDSQVTQADIKASNGVIHEIDTVLMPKE